MPEKLLIDVPQEGYQLREPEGLVARAKVSAGRAWQRLDQLGAPLEADVQMFLSPTEYQYWRVFWRAVIAYGTIPFLMDLVLDTPAVEECEVLIDPGTYSSSVRGTAHLVQFQIEIKRPAVPDSDFDDTLLMLYGLYGSDTDSFLDLLEEVVNVDLPGVM